MREVNLIVIHCSATRVDREYTPEQMDADHQERGFIRAGYHFYIRKNGKVVHFRHVSKAGAHAFGYNANSIGICYEGGLDTTGKAADTRTPEQKSRSEQILKELLIRFPGSDICGHRDLSNDLNGDGVISPDEWIKMCPCFNAREEYRPLVEENKKYVKVLAREERKLWRG